MTTVRPRFDPAALCEAAGARTFARGEDYHRSGLVTLLAAEGDRVLAEVSGTDLYLTTVYRDGATIGGECSCPAYTDSGFCKHMVAVALAANEEGTAGPTDGDDGPATALSRIRRHLHAQGVDALVEMVVGFAERDAALFRRLETAATLAGGGGPQIARRLSEAIDEATWIDGFVAYREARDWAAGVDDILDAVASLVPAGHAELARELAEQALDRLEGAIGQIDDSNGHCGGLLERAGEIHHDACRAAPPDPAALARELFVRQTATWHDAFYDAHARYADVLGEAGLAEFRRLAEAEWEALPVRAADSAKRPEYNPNYDMLARILDFFAERDGDTEARIALRKKNLTGPWDYLRLAEFCLSLGRDEEALRYAEEGLWLFEDSTPRTDELAFFAADLLERHGRPQDAEAHLWRAFEKSPNLALYKRLRELAPQDAYPRAVSQLRALLAKPAQLSGSVSPDFLVAVMILEKKYGEAWAAVREFRVSPGQKEALARASETSHPEEALAVYAPMVEDLAAGGGNPAYEKAAALIARMAALQDRAVHTAYLLEVKKRHHRKRNFMKLLE